MRACPLTARSLSIPPIYDKRETARFFLGVFSWHFLNCVILLCSELYYDAAMTPALETLFLPYSNGQLPAEAGAALFVNAMYAPDLQRFNAAHLRWVQWFKPYAQTLERAGFKEETGDVAPGSYDAAMVLGSKSRLETEIYLARATRQLKKGGVLVVAAGNKEGAGRLKKMLLALGYQNIAEQSKNKARVFWAEKGQINQDVLTLWLQQDNEREIPGGFVSRPGVYGWDKIDRGSQILADHMPRDLKGKGADFGCGYGFLSYAVLDKNKKIKALDFIDADSRAVALCEKNIAGFAMKKQGIWMDLTAEIPRVAGGYDWIVMNPPFHEGKKSDSDIGVSFIKNAHQALRGKGGALYMVANNQMPYERVLNDLF